MCDNHRIILHSYQASRNRCLSFLQSIPLRDPRAGIWATFPNEPSILWVPVAATKEI